MKRLCRCGLEFRYNIENYTTEYVTDNGIVVPMKFCHECGGKLDRIDLTTLLSTYFTQKNFMEAIKIWDEEKVDVICLYAGRIYTFNEDIEYRLDFKMNAGMVLDGEWYVSNQSVNNIAIPVSEPVAPTRKKSISKQHRNNEKERLEFTMDTF